MQEMERIQKDIILLMENYEKIDIVSNDIDRLSDEELVELYIIKLQKCFDEERDEAINVLIHRELIAKYIQKIRIQRKYEKNIRGRNQEESERE